MLIEKSGLPFPRGTTYSQSAKNGQNTQVTLSDTLGNNLEGRTYQVKDTIHNTGHFIRLRVVKNDSGAQLTNLRQLHSFSTASTTDWGKRIDGASGSQGEMCKPIDDAYYYGTESTAVGGNWTAIATNDLLYVVDEGPCLVETATDSEIGNYEQGVGCASDGSGRIELAVAGDTVIGTMMSEPAASSAVTANLIYIHPGVGVGVGA
jgi:hypothetical protein